MRKKYGRIAVFVLGCILAVWGMVIYPMLHRGTITVSVTNQSEETCTLLRINDQQIDEMLEPNDMLDVEYIITESGTLTAYVKTEGGEVLERLLTEGITPSVTPDNYGRVLLTIKEKDGALELSMISNISD